MKQDRGTKQTHNVAALGLTSITAFLLLGNAAPSQAQQSEVEALRAQIAAMTARLDKMEAEQKDRTAAAATAAAAAKDKPAVTARLPITMSGLLQVHGLGTVSNSGDSKRADTFRLRRGELRISGAITPRISGTIMLDPTKLLSANAGSVAAVPGTPSIAINQSSNILQELQLSYLLKKAKLAANNQYIDLGQFKIPIGYEGDLVSSGALQAVERALMFRQRDLASGGYGDIRETGAQLRGTLGSQFDYRLAVFNGLGERQNNLATSDNKAFVARLVYKPQGIQGLQLGVSGGIGNTRNTGSSQSSPGATRADRSVINLFGVYRKNKLTFQSEYLTADSQFVGSTTTRDIKSYYGSLGYLFNPKIEGVFRYDTFDFNRHGNDDAPKEITLGLNYYIKGNNAKIQLNLVRLQGAGEGVTGTAVPGGANGFQSNRTELRTNFQVAF